MTENWKASVTSETPLCVVCEDLLDTEPPCPNTKTEIIVYGRNGMTLAVCTDNECSVDNPHTA
ncbi:MAG: hypothetical protein NVSMB62_25450 [Acidobacteriaceae bacterium]